MVFITGLRTGMIFRLVWQQLRLQLLVRPRVLTMIRLVQLKEVWNLVFITVKNSYQFSD